MSHGWYVIGSGREGGEVGGEGAWASCTPIRTQTLLTSLLMPFTGLTDPVVHLGGLKGSAKSHL